ncbi:MAG: OmpH family outer membrane protein [Candidatus Xenobiia bacterium LiM19]
MGKNVFKIVAAVLIVAVVIVGGIFGVKALNEKMARPSEIGSIDRDAIFKLAAFDKANEKLQKKEMEMGKRFDTESRGLNPEQLQELRMRMMQELEAARANEIKPLFDRVQASIAVIGREKKLKIVLDKKIVVCGAQDITDDVKDKFRSEGELPRPEEDMGETSLIGYFDQDVVESLKIFRDAKRELMEKGQKMQKEIEDKSKGGLSDADKAKMLEEYNIKFTNEKERLMTPLMNKVVKTVGEVAKEKNLSMILDKQYVMYGGRNVTEEVTDKLIGKGK